MVKTLRPWNNIHPQLGLIPVRIFFCWISPTLYSSQLQYSVKTEKGKIQTGGGLTVSIEKMHKERDYFCAWEGTYSLQQGELEPIPDGLCLRGFTRGRQ